MDSFYIHLDNNISIANIWVEGGTRLDKNKKGINQILCNLLTRGCKNFDNFAFSDYLDSYGAELNFEAVEDGISICLKSFKQYFDELYPLINLLIEEPNLYEKEFLICKEKALNIILKAQENPFYTTFDNLKKTIYKEHPYSYSCNGYLKNIKVIDYEEILDEYKSFSYRKKFLLTNSFKDNLINIKEIKGNTYKNKDINLLKKKVINNKSHFINYYTNSKQMIIILGSQTCPHKHIDSLSLKIIESYLSYGMSSLLFKSFREKNGLTYDSGVFYPTRTYNAPFFVYLSAAERNAVLAYQLITSIWEDLTTKLIDDDELSLAKLKLKTFFLHNYQTVEEITSRKVRLLSLGMDPYYDEKAIDVIEKISSTEILNVTRKYLIKPSISISGTKNTCKILRELWEKKY